MLKIEAPLNAISLCGPSEPNFVAVAGRSIFKIFELYEEQNVFLERLNLRVGKINLNVSCTDVAWSKLNNEIIATSATNGAIMIWNITKSSITKQFQKFNEHKRTVNKIRFHPTEPHILLSGSQDGTMRYFDVRVPNSVHIFHGNSESVRDINFNSFKTNLFVAGQDNGTVQIWDIRHPNNCFREFSAHNGPTFSCEWHENDQNILASAGRDKSIKIWDLTNLPQLIQTLQSFASVSIVKWRPFHRGYEIASTALVFDLNISLWDSKNAYHPEYILTGHKDVVTGIQWRSLNPGYQSMISCGKDDYLFNHKLKNFSTKSASFSNPLLQLPITITPTNIINAATATTTPMSISTTNNLIDGNMTNYPLAVNQFSTAADKSRLSPMTSTVNQHTSALLLPPPPVPSSISLSSKLITSPFYYGTGNDQQPSGGSSSSVSSSIFSRRKSSETFLTVATNSPLVATSVTAPLPKIHKPIDTFETSLAVEDAAATLRSKISFGNEETPHQIQKPVDGQEYAKLVRCIRPMLLTPVALAFDCNDNLLASGLFGASSLRFSQPSYNIDSTDENWCVISHRDRIICYTNTFLNTEDGEIIEGADLPLAPGPASTLVDSLEWSVQIYPKDSITPSHDDPSNSSIDYRYDRSSSPPLPPLPAASRENNVVVIDKLLDLEIPENEKNGEIAKMAIDLDDEKMFNYGIYTKEDRTSFKGADDYKAGITRRNRVCRGNGGSSLRCYTNYVFDSDLSNRLALFDNYKRVVPVPSNNDDHDNEKCQTGGDGAPGELFRQACTFNSKLALEKGQFLVSRIWSLLALSWYDYNSNVSEIYHTEQYYDLFMTPEFSLYLHEERNGSKESCSSLPTDKDIEPEDCTKVCNSNFNIHDSGADHGNCFNVNRIHVEDTDRGSGNFKQNLNKRNLRNLIAQDIRSNSHINNRSELNSFRYKREEEDFDTNYKLEIPLNIDKSEEPQNDAFDEFFYDFTGIDFDNVDLKERLMEKSNQHSITPCHRDKGEIDWFIDNEINKYFAPAPPPPPPSTSNESVFSSPLVNPKLIDIPFEKIVTNHVTDESFDPFEQEIRLIEKSDYKYVKDIANIEREMSQYLIQNCPTDINNETDFFDSSIENDIVNNRRIATNYNIKTPIRQLVASNAKHLISPKKSSNRNRRSLLPNFKIKMSDIPTVNAEAESFNKPSDNKIFEKFYADVLRYLVIEKDDILTAIFLLINVFKWDTLSLDRLTVCHWFVTCIDYLRRLRLFVSANHVIKSCELEEISSLNRISTYYPNGPCPSCKKFSYPERRKLFDSRHLPKKPLPKCHKCRTLTAMCSLCNLPVKGLFVTCSSCLHGGHFDHIRFWFTKHRECPSGCGHKCSF